MTPHEKDILTDLGRIFLFGGLVVFLSMGGELPHAVVVALCLVLFAMGVADLALTVDTHRRQEKKLAAAAEEKVKKRRDKTAKKDSDASEEKPADSGPQDNRGRRASDVEPGKIAVLAREATRLRSRM